MIYRNMELYNLTVRKPAEDGGDYFLRAPESVDAAMGDVGKTQNRGSTGVEYRFVIHSGDVRLKLRTRIPGTEGRLYVWYGDFVADWPETEKKITYEPCELCIVQSPFIDWMRKLAKENGCRFSPDVVRLVLQTGSIEILDVQGDITPPTQEMLPKKKYLAYGSSITHGSISFSLANSFVSRIGEYFGAEERNLGFAGSACLEPEMADFLAAQEFDFATLEMGINILGMDPEKFEKRVRYLVSKVATSHPASPVFAIDVFYCKSDIFGDGRAEAFRKIVERVTRELALPNVVYVKGTSVLPDGRGMSSGIVHPGPRAIETMAENLCRIMAPYVKN